MQLISTLSNIIAPVFLVLALGYSCSTFKFINKKSISTLMWFAQSIALPCLLFINVLKLDFGIIFNWSLLISFYGAALICFLSGFIGAIYIFSATRSNAVAIGFCALFSNSVLLGLPITEQAYGVNALEANFVIVALHAPFCYLVGITFMEATSLEVRRFGDILIKILGALFSNALTVSIFLAFFFNLVGLKPPFIVMESIDLLAHAGLPIALFGLGAILTEYKLSKSIGEAIMISLISLIVHPLITFYFGSYWHLLNESELRSAVLTAAMAPGVNTFLFANIYNKSQDIAANTILISTALSVFSVSCWLLLLNA